jgi:glycosyltransferase involved in cell wall biosynthesis
MKRAPAQITAIITAYKNIPQTLETIARILACDPPPVEILVHVDGGQLQCAEAVRTKYPEVQVLVSSENVGPGGGRNKLIAAARTEIVASFDDDSYPLDADYFHRLTCLFDSYPEAAVLSATILERGDPVQARSEQCRWRSDFGGGGCAYRRQAFLAAGEYVPLPIAYGMEEVDMALRLYAKRWGILQSDSLRVFHDSDLSRHASPRVTSTSIANIALLTFLRYPVWLWPVGAVQILKRVRWLLMNGRSKGVLLGFAMIPRHCWHHRMYRNLIEARELRGYLALRREPLPAAERTGRHLHPGDQPYASFK